MARPSRRPARIVVALVLAAVLFAAGGLTASSQWRAGAQRAVLPTPAAPMLPVETVAYGTDDETLRYFELVMSPAERALRERVEARFGRTRGFRYAWPKDVAIEEGQPAGRDDAKVLFRSLDEAAAAAGWSEIEGTRAAYSIARTVAFERNGHVFAVAVGHPRMSDAFNGEGRFIHVPVFGEPGPVPGAYDIRFVPLFVLTTTFDPDGASYPESVVAPFLRRESRVRMRRRASSEVVVVDRSTFEEVCLESGGSAVQRAYAPCAVSDVER